MVKVKPSAESVIFSITVAYDRPRGGMHLYNLLFFRVLTADEVLPYSGEINSGIEYEAASDFDRLWALIGDGRLLRSILCQLLFNYLLTVMSGRLS
jgi:hypothetical protein